MATIRKRITQKGVVWTAEIKRRGQPRESKTFSRRTDAATWARRRETEISESRANPNAAARRYTVSDMLGRYRDEVLPGKRKTTVLTQDRQLVWWERQIGHMFLADVLPATLNGCLEKLRKQGKANATRVRYLAVLSHAFSVAVRDWELCAINPCKLVSKPREPRGRVRFLADDERRTLLYAADACHNPAIGVIVRLGLCTSGVKVSPFNMVISVPGA